MWIEVALVINLELWYLWYAQTFQLSVELLGDTCNTSYYVKCDVWKVIALIWMLFCDWKLLQMTGYNKYCVDGLMKIEESISLHSFRTHGANI
jgi:predicted Abi (CAAX) family protease